MGIEYTKDGKRAKYMGVNFVRDEQTGYYLNSKLRKRLHRLVWESHNGEIPNGKDVHHKDHDKNNNEIENLCLITRNKHASLHGKERAKQQEWIEWATKNLKENAIPKASEWHRSEEGRSWHKKHYQEYKHLFHKTEKYKCEFCGESFETQKGNNRFCSNKCKSAWRRKTGVDNEVRSCEYCKQQFEVNKYEKTRFCSRSCTMRARHKSNLD